MRVEARVEQRDREGAAALPVPPRRPPGRFMKLEFVEGDRVWRSGRHAVRARRHDGHHADVAIGTACRRRREVVRRQSPPPSFTPSDLPKVSDASTMRASISTWRTGDVELLDQFGHLRQTRRNVGDEQLVGARLRDHAAARAQDARRRAATATAARRSARACQALRNRERLGVVQLERLRAQGLQVLDGGLGLELELFLGVDLVLRARSTTRCRSCACPGSWPA
jgi:hypothetical protein